MAQIPRFFDSKVVVTEKIDGTNAQIFIKLVDSENPDEQKCEMFVGSRTKWITPDDDNYGFAKWAYANEEELIATLGQGAHFGEWWGQGIQRKYDMDRKVFSLFNVHRWGELWNHDPGESLCDVVPFKIFELSEFGSEEPITMDTILDESQHYFMRQSRAAEKYGKSFDNPEGYCIWHDRSRQIFKVPVNKQEATIANTWYVGDLHLGHEGMVRFTDKDGKKIRPYKTIEEHDETIIANINALVKPADRLYFLGDVVINRRCLPLIARINGRKKLIKGNHDIFPLKDYTPYFEDIVAYRIYPKHGIIMSHIPVHPNQLEHRFKWNVHGHLHSNLVLGGKHPMTPDERYINICPEHTKFQPVSFDELLTKIGWESEQYKYVQV